MAIKKTDKTIHIAVDPRIELLAVVQFLSGYDKRYNLITRFDFSYKQDVREHFSEYKDHAAVTLFDKMSAQVFNFDAPPAAMLYLSDPPELAQVFPFTGYLNRRAGGNKRLTEFVELLRDFAVDTNFMTFYETHTDVFQQMVADTRAKMGSINYIRTLEGYYGMNQGRCAVLLAPLLMGGFGPRVEQLDGSFDIYNVMGPLNLKDDMPSFGSKTSFRYMVWHEFGHSFVNPTTSRFKKDINKYKALYDPIAADMQQQAYGNWENCVNEHLVRAVTTRLSYREIGMGAGIKALHQEKNRHFAYVELLCKRLEYYEEQRDIYPSFVDFYPELIKVFGTLSEKDLSDDFYCIPALKQTR